jgi:thiosulfate sulfurtransferase
MSVVPEVSVDQAKKRLNEADVIFIDIRDFQAYYKAHIPGAVHLDRTNVDEFLKNTDPNRPLIVYCDQEKDSLSGTIFFLDQGFKKVYNLVGGFDAWQQRCGPELVQNRN